MAEFKFKDQMVKFDGMEFLSVTEVEKSWILAAKDREELRQDHGNTWHKLYKNNLLDTFYPLRNKEEEGKVRISEHVFTIWSCFKKLGGATLYEVAKELDWPSDRVSPRLKELRELGLLRGSGKYGKHIKRAEIFFAQGDPVIGTKRRNRKSLVKPEIKRRAPRRRYGGLTCREVITKLFTDNLKLRHSDVKNLFLKAYPDAAEGSIKRTTNFMINNKILVHINLITGEILDTHPGPKFSKKIKMILNSRVEEFKQLFETREKPVQRNRMEASHGLLPES